jgi:hypothetical protein
LGIGDDGKFYGILYTAEEDDFEQYMPEIDQMISSFQVK